MSNVPTFINLLFSASALFTIWMFYKASYNSKIVSMCILVWMIIQSVASYTGFYQILNTVPPRFVLLICPGFIFIILLFTTSQGKKFIDSLNPKQLTLIHSVRVPVEITLYYLYKAGFIPIMMTFEGNNLDILSGITAPTIYYFVFINKKLNNKVLLIWNVLCIGLLMNVLIIAILSAQTPFQQLAFEQPNIGVTVFPYVWLPSIIVPIVLIAHLSVIRQLLQSRIHY